MHLRTACAVLRIENQSSVLGDGRRSANGVDIDHNRINSIEGRHLTKLTQLPTRSIRIAAERRVVRIDDATTETEQHYLTIAGSPDGLRWLARNLNSLAASTEQSSRSSGNIVAPWDFSNEPILLDGWDAIDFYCTPSND